MSDPNLFQSILNQARDERKEKEHKANLIYEENVRIQSSRIFMFLIRTSPFSKLSSRVRLHTLILYSQNTKSKLLYQSKKNCFCGLKQRVPQIKNFETNFEIF